MSSEQYSSLRRNVSTLGRMLGDTVSDAYGKEFLAKVEEIRKLSKSARLAGTSDTEQLRSVLFNLNDQELVQVARAFGQFLNLANIADQHHTISREMDKELSATQTLNKAFENLITEGTPKDSINNAIKQLNIELVLTAHPTEITRRTLIHKHGEIDACLSQLELQGLTERENISIHNRLRELIAQIWHTHDFRETRPTPVDEAKWAFAVIENSLWQAVPDFLRRLDSTLADATGERIPLSLAPVTFSSWIGGDRDGNPNVTANLTEEVLLLSRWQAAHLYERDIEVLIEELSMSAADKNLLSLTDNHREPYRATLRLLRSKIRATKAMISAQLIGEELPESQQGLMSDDDLFQPLNACYQSLVASGMQIIANGKLLDSLRRVKCFGIHLVRLDVRQNAEHHTQALSELTQYLDLGDYSSWTEQQKQNFLLSELENKRPLIPSQWQPSALTQEVLSTFAVATKQPKEALGCYVISMASQPSDVLAVELLLKASGRKEPLPVVPLFETLDDLNRAVQVVDQLLNIPNYLKHLNGKMMVMIGYSDSAKDAGMLAASWGQYRAQEELLERCQQNNIKLTLFHGRGGTIGRGGAPAHAALLSQPPGSLVNGLRVTEQGEMIRTKLGLKGIAIKTLSLYTSAILQANLKEPPCPKDDWREIMNKLSDLSARYYRNYVKEHPDFVSYFRQATPEQELSKLPLGSRPARRKADGGIESLRAIPWIFAWTQNRLMLPAWLGAGQAFIDLISQGEEANLKLMTEHWPFFATRISMLEMVFAKADTELSAYYDKKLVSTELAPLGENLRQQLVNDRDVILKLLDKRTLLEDQDWSKESILLRNIYAYPLNFLQVELLRRNRERTDSDAEKALMVTIAGIAAGMRNTG